MSPAARRTMMLVLSCEHATCEIPPRWRSSFRGHAALLRSHRGWDAGALHLARRLARDHDAPLVAATFSRLLVDANRSPDNRDVWSSLTRELPAEERATILTLHTAHRERVAAAVSTALAERPAVLHLAVHSFVPVLHGVRRPMDVGLLYDPARPLEREIADRWRAILGRDRPDLVVRRNAPYRGVSDGLTRSLRRRWRPDRYAGIELEINQSRLQGRQFEAALVAAVSATLAEVLGAPSWRRRGSNGPSGGVRRAGR